jgi:hypothetical protein
MGSFMRHVPNSAETDPFNKRIRAFKDDTVDQLPDKFENWEAPVVKEALAGIQRADQVQQARLENQKTGDMFIAGHGEYIDSVPNAQLMRHQLVTMFGDRQHSLGEFEQAYAALRESNFLALNKTEVARQQKEAAKQRYESERAKSVEPSEQQLYDMPLEDLRRLDAISNQERIHREGERGSW